MSYVYLGQQNNQSTPPSVGSNTPPSSGGDGINWPYNADGQTPNFFINWNSNPPPSAQQVEQTYQSLLNWLNNNTGSPAFYNGSIEFLQVTVDIGQHLSSFSPSDQAQLKQFLSNQVSTGQDQNLLQLILDTATEGVVISSSNNVTALANAQAFLKAIEASTSGLHNSAPWSSIYQEAQSDQSTIGMWIDEHWEQIQNAPTQYQWVDNNGQPVTFAQFTLEAQFAIGSRILSANNSVSNTINAYYQTEIQSLVAEFKGNPWALLVALMGLINQRDQDNGTAINGYGGTLSVMQTANGYIQKMLGDISGSTPNMSDFYTQLANLQNLALNDPALSSVASQLEADVSTINGNTFTPPSSGSMTWSMTNAGYYTFPSGSTVTIGGQSFTAGPTSPIYVPAGASVQVQLPSGTSSLNFGQLAAMGDYGDITTQMQAWTNPSGSGSGSGTNWSSEIMSNFENGVTGIQTLLNSPSAAIQQQIQNLTQTMQAEESFENQAYQTITNVNQQIMSLVSSTIG